MAIAALVYYAGWYLLATLVLRWPMALYQKNYSPSAGVGQSHLPLPAEGKAPMHTELGALDTPF